MYECMIFLEYECGVVKSVTGHKKNKNIKPGLTIIDACLNNKTTLAPSLCLKLSIKTSVENCTVFPVYFKASNRINVFANVSDVGPYSQSI